MNLTTIPILLNNVIQAGYSIDNLAMGMGGGLLQQVNRDTVRFAMKCSAIYDGSKWHSVNKSPTTDNTKSSKGGRLDLVYNEVNKQFMTTTNFDVRLRSVLQTIYFNGSQFNTTTLAAIRQRANKSLED
jgi:nicotinamide phosphoribosyltransferase